MAGLIVFFALSGCGDADMHDNAAEGQRRTILIPLYAYPNWWDEENYVWQKLIDVKNAHPKSAIIAVVNPDNGHFRERNADYERGISDLKKAGISVIGYVYTSYARRDIEEIKDDIDAWKKYYGKIGAQGIFFDETSTDVSALSFYRELADYARTQSFNIVVLNPGTTTDQSYIDAQIADVVVTYENDYASLEKNPPENYNTPSHKTHLALLIHTMKDDHVKSLDKFANDHRFDYVYYTEDGSDGNPWDSVSMYIEKEVVSAQ
jgi:hypothetical protein